MEHIKKNPVAVAMVQRYGKTSKAMKDRRTKRQNRQSWKKDLSNY